jgi:hypothetical protein
MTRKAGRARDLGGNLMPGFGTKRVAKSVDGERLHVTIGETQKGQGANLDEIVEAIIRSEGLEVLRLPTTDGNRKDEKIYPGFDLSAVSDDQLRIILRRVQANIDALI